MTTNRERKEVSFESLGDYLRALDGAGEVKRIKASVDIDLEVAEILRRTMYSGGPALLFENIEGYDMPILGNAFGSLRRMQIALGTEKFEELGRRNVKMMTMEPPSGMVQKLRAIPRLQAISSYAPYVVKKGSVEEIVETSSPTLSAFPVTKSWPKDAGRFITMGITITRHPDPGRRNLGLYRLQIIDETTVGMHWQIHHRGAHHYKTQSETQKRLEVAVVIGADPATIFSAVAPVPEGLDKYLFAGIIKGKGIPLVKCRTIDLEVPANAEIVLEGYVEPEERHIEGPFGDHTGYYTPPESFPVFHLTGILRRERPLYLCTVVGKPILEDAYIGKAVERIFLPLMQVFHPEIVDFSMPSAGWFQGLAIVSIKKTYPGQARKVMMALWGLGQLMLTKMIVVVDHEVNIHDVNDVIWAVTTRVDPQRDVFIVDHTPTDTLDPTAPSPNLGSKLGIDATVKMKEEGWHWMGEAQLAVPDPSTVELVNRRWQEYGFS